jgi:hypothetical protein
MLSQSTRQYFNKLGIAPQCVFSRPRTPNDTLRARIDAHFGTLKSQPVYPGCFAAIVRRSPRPYAAETPSISIVSLVMPDLLRSMRASDPTLA